MQNYYRLDVLPDLTLNRYQSLGAGDVNDIVEKHNAFLRHWHRIAYLAHISMHLIIRYDPKLPASRKLEIGFLLSGNADTEYFNKMDCVMRANALSSYYRFQKHELDIQQKYTCSAMLYKKERFLRPAVQQQGVEAYYVVPTWEMQEESRLYSMLKLMEALDDACIYRVDLYPVSMSEKYHEVLEPWLIWLRERNGFNRDIIKLNTPTAHPPRDPNAEETLKQYEDWLKKLDTQPHFITNISVFANDTNNAQILLDAAASEAIDAGYNNIDVKNGNFSILYGIDRPFDDLHSRIAPEALKRWPCLFTLEEVSPFFRFPALYDGEIIECPKETAPILNTDGICLGEDNNGYSVYIPPKLLTKHMFVCGVPGAGKTNTMLHLCNSLYRQGVPFLVLEPAKKEYRALVNYDIDDLIVVSPSARTKFPIGINPFEMPIGMSVSEHINNLMSVFEGAFPMEPPAPFLLDRAIESIYRKKGLTPNTINTGAGIEFPTMQDLYNQFENELDATNYAREIRDNLRSVLEVRIGSLLRREMGSLFNVRKSTLTPEDWLKYPIVVELEAMATGPANFTTLLLCTLIREVLKVAPHCNPEKTLRHVIFIEEAHNLIAPSAVLPPGVQSDPKIAATQYIVKMLAEVRALREGMIIADQLPTAMAPEVIKNTNIKLVHRLTADDDRSLVGSTMSANNLQIESLTTYLPGHALITYEGLLRPFEVQVFRQQEHDDTPPNDTALLAGLLFKPRYSHFYGAYLLENAVYRPLVKLRDLAILMSDTYLKWADMTEYSPRERYERYKTDMVNFCRDVENGLAMLKRNIPRNLIEEAELNFTIVQRLCEETLMMAGVEVRRIDDMTVTEGG